jgi:CelD/BcsL family acetyltransferase involved in cellulose biosynthesis
MAIDVAPPANLSAGDLATWREIQRTSIALANPFLSPEFTRAVAEVKPGVRVARLSSAGRTIGFLPFERARTGIGRPIASGLSDAQGVVHAEAPGCDAGALLEACGIAVLEFDHLVAGQPVFAEHVRRTEPSPIIDLTEGYGAYIEARRAGSRSFRRLLARHAALHAEQRDVRFEYRTLDPGAFAALFAWKSDQYRRTGRVDRFAKPWVRRLLSRLMATEGEHFSGVLACLRVDGQPVAVQAALATSSVLSLWFPAYDLAFARYSPGNLLRLELIRAAAERGIERIDMGKGFSVHKEHLKTGDIEVAEARIERRGARALANRAYRVPPRRVERFVLDHPRLRLAARRTLARIGGARVAVQGR